MQQLTLLLNGNLAPCPYTDNCFNYPAGCGGATYYCHRFDEASDADLKEAKEYKIQHHKKLHEAGKYIRTCQDKEEAKSIIDKVGARFVADWEFLPDGKVKLLLEPNYQTRYLSDEWSKK